MTLLKHFARPSLDWLLLFLPIAAALEAAHGVYHAAWATPTWIFACSAIAIIPVAGWMGHATEHLASRLGEGIGGLLNATFGNAAELIIACMALRQAALDPAAVKPMHDLIKASLTGSIIGNLLLVLGASVLIGGLRHGTQTFSQRIAGANAALLVVAVIGLFVPAVFAFTTSQPGQGSLTEESVLVSFALIAGYVLSLIYQFTNPQLTLGGHGEPEGHAGPAWSAAVAIVVLVVAAGLLALLSEILVGSIEGFIDAFGLTPFFVGVIVIPTIGNLAEHLVAVQLAAKDKMEFSMAVSYGSSLQVALFVAPVLVLIAALLGQPMDLVFTPLEVAAVAAAVGISALIALDGESNWLEGALLMLVYLILAFSFFEFV